MTDDVTAPAPRGEAIRREVEALCRQRERDECYTDTNGNIRLRWERIFTELVEAKFELAAVRAHLETLTQELKLNAEMLARQCDLARIAENERDGTFRQFQSAERDCQKLQARAEAAEAERDRLEQVVKWQTEKHEQAVLNLSLQLRAAEAERDSLRAQLNELDTLADRYATSHGGYVGNAKGVLLTLLEPKA